MEIQLQPLFVILLCFGFNQVFTQSLETGPVIVGYGAVWKVENPGFRTATSGEFKVVFDIMDSPESHDSVNKSIETAARFLNMHAQSGVSGEQMKVALVVHNRATRDILSNEAYRAHFGKANPNSELIKELLESGVEVILCGQSAASRNFPVSESINGVQLALSAMTALVQLQDKGYRLIKF
ncbi:MAG TPA: DsrE family protein [Eudoraea sp.]|nr:DsrE family protein [Eudoraea sp.]